MRQVFAKREATVSLSLFSLKDRKVVSSQMEGRNFESSLVLYTAARCKWGHPQVLCCAPLLKGYPFPTIFWLCCPHLSHQCGVLESQGGVRLLEEFLRDHEAEYRRYQSDYALLRLRLISPCERQFLKQYRPRLWQVLRRTGIGGIRPGGRATAKCLHLQTGTALALSGHPARMWLKERLGSLSCDDCRCGKRP